MTSTRDSAELVNNLKDSAFDFNIYSSVASAKADTKLKAGDTVQTTGYYSENDGGGASYIVVAGGTGTDDGGSYHDMANGNQLELLAGNSIKFEVFGGIPDGLTDNSGALNAMNLYMGTAKGGAIEFSGSYRFASGVTLNSESVRYQGVSPSSGDSLGTTFLIDTGSSDFLTISNASYFKISNIRLSGQSITGGRLMSIDGSLGVTLDNCRMVNFFNGIEIKSCNSTTIRDCQLINANTSADYAIRFLGVNGAKSDLLTIYNTTINLGSSNDTTDGLRWDSYADTLRLNNFIVLNGRKGIFSLDSASSGNSRPAFLFANDVEIENTNQQSLHFAAGVGCWAVNCYFNASETSNGVQIDSSYEGNATFLGGRCRGHSKDGFNIGSKNIHIIGVQTGNNSTGGIGLDDNIAFGSSSEGCSVVGGMAGLFDDAGVNNARYGINAAGTNITVNNVDLSSNNTAGANGFAGSSNRFISNCIGYSNEKYGQATITPDGTGVDAIPHGLSGTPTFVSLNIKGDTQNIADPQSVDSTNITVRIKDSSGVDVVSGSYQVYWMARN